MNEQTDPEFALHHGQLLDAAPIPVIWLLGKTGSGKSSIIRYLTGASDAEIGNGFRPETRWSRIFDFPDSVAPLMQFRDTRGLGETDYDPAADLDAFERDAHLVIVTVRAVDHAIDELVAALKQIRRQAPDRPVLLVLTALHDGYPGQPHPVPDPFDNVDRGVADPVPDDLQRSIAAHLKNFAGIVDRVIAIDLTRPGDGYTPEDFGGQRLKDAVLDMLPAAWRIALSRMDRLNQELAEAHQREVAPVILGYSSLAAAAASIPLPWADIPLVLGIQSRLAWRLAELNQQPIDSRTIATVSAAMGGRIAARMAVREALKFVPWVGIAVNAAATFALTFASGWAWNWYFMQVGKGHIPTSQELQQVFREQLQRGEAFWKETNENNSA